MSAVIHEENRYGRPARRIGLPGQAPALTGEGLQEALLKGVSRTFALTIPQLPAGLSGIVSNAYLLCRIVDTIEDEPALSPEQKRYFCEQFVRVVSTTRGARRFAAELAPLLSDQTIPAEHALIRSTPEVIRITGGIAETQRQALQRCIRVMAEGMAEFQDKANSQGVQDLTQLDRYCYYVAGVVGEMLTQLFCAYSGDISKRKDALMELAVSFGQGLQMTNILKDIWDDQRRGACWLPQDVFSEEGFDLLDLTPSHYRASFGQGLARLIGITRGHLDDALAYTLLIPKNEAGIRNFCLWAIGMAVLTLRKIYRHRDFRTSGEVKISRRSVRMTILASRLALTHDRMLRSLFHMAEAGLPPAPVDESFDGP